MVVLNHLVTLDTRLDGYTAFNYQNTTTEEYLSHDISSKPLFTSVHEAFFNGDTYKAYNNLIMFYKNPDVDVRETITSAWEDSISYFLDTVMKTPVMKSAHQFLVQKGLTTSETASFKNLLHSLWFDLYARNNETGSSGFESAFAGEVQGNNVIRFNNWLRFHQQEKLGLINYYGWFNKADHWPVLLSIELSIDDEIIVSFDPRRSYTFDL
uniref:Endoribonuclease n=1 Tax=Angiostrongylus cantonensis TaxID=6313 RepID=A0A0K0D5Z8_ANGCA